MPAAPSVMPYPVPSRRGCGAAPTLRRASVALALLAGLTACGGDSSTAPPPPAVSVSISPTSATAPAGGTAQFTATVTNARNTAVTWTASGGTVAPSGTSATWPAPGADGSYTITATSSADASRSATATITVTPVTIAVAPSTSTIGAGDTVMLVASVTGGVNEAVTWSASAGTVIGTGANVQ